MSDVVRCEDPAHVVAEWAPKLKVWRCNDCKRLLAEDAPAKDAYVRAALAAGRPSKPCACRECDCPLHSYPGVALCVWCRNGHHETERRLRLKESGSR